MLRPVVRVSPVVVERGAYRGSVSAIDPNSLEDELAQEHYRFVEESKL